MTADNTTSRLIAFAMVEITAAADLAEKMTVPDAEADAKARICAHLRVANGVLSGAV